MRTPPKVSGALTARAIAGTHAVLLGFDVTSPGPDFLGFAIHRTDLATGQGDWLPNFLRFAANDHADGPTGTDRNPLQAFQWGDYTVGPGQRLKYRVVMLSGTPGNPVAGDEVELDVRCESADDGRHGIHFNRGVAGSQAYTRKFGDGSPLEIPAAAEWMSRGLEEALLAFIDRAQGPGWALRGAFYEFFHPPVLQALHKAARAGAEVALAVSCPSSGGWPDYPAWQNIDAIRAFPGRRTPPPAYKGLSAFVKPRTHAKAIAHNKFLVLLKDGTPQGVWTGSTNVTPGALYGQSNVGHAVWDEDVAKVFLGYWDILRRDGDATAYTESETPLGAIKPAGTSVLLSPRADLSALIFYGDLIRAAGQAVFITGPFGLADEISGPLGEQRDILRYELLEKSDDKDLMKVLLGDPDNRIAAGAYLGGPGGWHQFLREQLTGLNEHVKYIHTKYLLVDPLTTDPTVVTGSANFSRASTEDNDENMLVIRGDERVADIYLSEFMRLFTHLRFRSAAVKDSTRTDRRAPDPAEPAISAPIHLAEDGAWATKFYVPNSPRARERMLFAGTD